MEFIIVHLLHPIKGLMIGLMIASLIVFRGDVYIVACFLLSFVYYYNYWHDIMVLPESGSFGFHMTEIVIFVLVSRTYVLTAPDRGSIVA